MNELNHTVEMLGNQTASIREYIGKLFQKLPQSLDVSAKKYLALARRRCIKSAESLLLALFLYASSKMSLRGLAASAAVMGIADISDQAWQKKVIRCEPWLTHLANESISKLSDKSKKVYGGSREVNLLDGSIVLQEGTGEKVGADGQPIGGSALRLHTCYGLSKGCMGETVLTDNHTAESVKIFTINPGGIYIADACYGHGKNIAYIVSCGADAIFRATPNHLSLAKDKSGKDKIDMAQELSDTKAAVMDFSCYVHTENRQYVPVRVVASRLPEDKALLAKERKARDARKWQTKNTRPQTFVYACWVIVITTLGEEYSTGDILNLYRSRWQIELLFKRIKQAFSVYKLPVASITHSKAMVML